MMTASLLRALYATISTRMETRNPIIVGGGGAIKIPEPGYYLIVDTINFNDGDHYHAYNSFLLVNDTHQGEYNVIINHKVVKPTVEKKVYDNDNNDISSAGGWAVPLTMQSTKSSSSS